MVQNLPCVLLPLLLIFFSGFWLTVSSQFIVTVNDLSDDGVPNDTCLAGGSCSLRDAWEMCKNVSSPVADCTIFLPPSSEIITNSSNGPLRLDPFNNIKIVSNQSTSIRSDGQAYDSYHSRLVYFLSFENGIQAALSLEGLIISGFGMSYGSGGAIYNYGNVIYSINNCTFFNNTGRFGGSIIFRSNLAGIQITNSHFEAGQAFNGGAIEFDDDVTGVLVENCTFLHCQADQHGGAIFLGDRVVNFTLRGSDILACAAGYGGGGLGLFADNVDVLVDRSRFLYNSALMGGSIAILLSNREIRIVNTEIGYSYASELGGGVVAWSENEVSIDGTWVHDTYAYYYGGGIYFYEDNFGAQIANSLFENCSSDSQGGALNADVTNHYLHITATTFMHCRSTIGGVMMVREDNDFLYLDGVTVEHCYSSEGGGGISLLLNNDNFVMKNSVFRNCTTLEDGGGLLIGAGNFHMRIQETNFTGCVGGQGGAIALLVDTNNFTLTHSRIENCVGNSGGALALMNEHDQVLIHKTVFLNNHAVNGGAIHSNPHTSLMVVAGSTFVGNSASRDGGAIFLNGANEKFLVTDTETARRVQIGETTHPYECVNPPMVVLDHTDLDATAFQIQIDSKSVIGALDDFLILDGTGETVFYGVFDRQWPGVQMPPLVIPGTRVRVWLTCNNETDVVTLSRNLYGMRVVATPIFADPPEEPSVFAFNKAGGSGGAIAAPYGAAFGRIINAEFSYNSAVKNGGALSLGSAGTGVMMMRSTFRENEAGISGGAVSLGSACDSTDIISCTFDLNSAGDSGGALAMIFGNGATAILTDGTATKVSTCTFTQNSATRGGALYLDKENVVMLESALLLDNEAFESGGGVYAGTDNDIYLNDSRIMQGRAARAGGGVASEARNAFVLVNVGIHNNTAGKYGGGVYTSGGTTVHAGQNVSVENNVAAVAGGGLASFECPLWDRDDGSTLVIAGNRAQRGSALYLKALLQPDDDDAADNTQQSSDSGLRDMLIANNVATVGGTVYWLYDSDMTSEPEGVNSTSVAWEGNVALYGERVATQAIQVQGPAEYTVEVFGQALDPPLEFGLQDLYGQEMPIQGPTVVAAKLEGTSASNCSGRTPFLSGNQQEEMNYTAEFTKLQANCAPDGEITVAFTAALLDLTEVAEAGRINDYAVAKTVTMTYRSCRRGEYIQDGQCVSCPTGTYSLEYPVTQDTACMDCTGKSGVVTCYGDVIEVSGGYWRRHNTSEAVLDCLGDVNGCAGGEGTGDALCEEGYEGPLCAVCADGYYSSNGICELCSGDTKLSTTTIVFVGIAGVVIVVAIFMFYAKCLDDEVDEELGPTSESEKRVIKEYTTKNWIQQQFQDMRAQLKIVITTYQIVSEVPGNLSVEFPSAFTSFLKAFAVFNLNVISVVPFSCTRHYTFIDKLVATTLFPVALSLLLALLCAVDVARLTYMGISNGQDTKERIRMVKDQYLTYFFFLTYLVLPSVSTTIFQTFLCTNVDPRAEDNDEYDSYLIADMSISCTSSYYYRGVAYAVAMLLVYVVGIPLMYFLLLYYNREAIARRDDPVEQDDAGQAEQAASTKSVGLTMRELPASVRRLSFLWDAYEPQFWYWEVVETTRRLMLTAVLSVCGPGTSAQSIFAVLLGLLYIKLYGFFAPYEEDNDDVVAEVGQFQIFFSFLGALIYQNSLLGSEWNDAVSVVLIAINAAVTLLFFYYGVLSVREEWKERQESIQHIKEKHKQDKDDEDEREVELREGLAEGSARSSAKGGNLRFSLDEETKAPHGAEGVRDAKLISEYFWS